MKEGNFVLIDFVGRIAGTNEIFDLTHEDIAKKEGIYTEKHKYEPALVIIGAKMVIPGIEEELVRMKVGEEREFTVKPDKGFGYRSPGLVKIISMSKFLHEKINPVPGLFVTIDNRQAKVQSVSGGRVRVDFNNPLAGKELHYRLKTVKAIKTSQEKVKALLNYYNIKGDISITNDTLTIKTSKKLEPVIEKLLSETIKKWIKEIKSVICLHTDSKKA